MSRVVTTTSTTSRRFAGSLRTRLLLLLLGGIITVIVVQAFLQLTYAQTQTDLQVKNTLDINYQAWQESITKTQSVVAAVAVSIANRPDVAPLVKAGDHDGLIKLMRDLFNELEIRDKYNIKYLYFHDSAGMVIVRLHNPARFGDNAAQARPSVADALAKRKPTSGVELGPTSLGVTGVAPVMDGNTLVGAVEVDIDIDGPYVSLLRDTYGADFTLWVEPQIAQQAGYEYSKPAFASPVDSLFFYSTTRSKPIPTTSAALTDALSSSQSIPGRVDAPDGQQATVFWPLLGYGYRHLGVLEISYSMQKQEEALRNSQLQVVAVSVLLIGLALLGFLWIVHSQVLTPITAMQAAIRRWQAGAYATRTKVIGANEMRELGIAFNNLAQSVQMRDEELTKANEILTAQAKTLLQANTELQAAKDELQVSNTTLEERVQERTAELEKAKVEAERANRVKSTFLASMSHELRTPLNAIINFSTFVAEGDMGPVNDEQASFLFQVLDSGKHLLALINDVLDMSKIESGTLYLFVEDKVNVREILINAQSTGKALLGTKPVELRMEAPEDLPLIRADRQRIFQVMLNMISNACKFTTSGSIIIRAWPQDEMLMISIRDTGPGIAAEDHEKVFRAFEQTETGIRQGGGTGLGMPISKNLIEAHNGRMWLESERGQGTTFFIALPLVSSMPVSP